MMHWGNVGTIGTKDTDEDNMVVDGCAIIDITRRGEADRVRRGEVIEETIAFLYIRPPFCINPRGV